MSHDLPAPRDHQPDTSPTELDDEQVDAEFRAIAARSTAGTSIPVPEHDGVPGFIEVVTPEEYARSEREFRIRQGGPAMVALAYTGRAVGLTVRGIGRVLSWTATGGGAVAALGWQYLRAHDYSTKLGGAADESSYNKVRKMRRQRWKFLAWSAPLGAAAANAAGWAALVWGAGMTAADSMWITPSVLTGGLLAAFTVYGRYRKQHKVKGGQVIAPQHMAELEAAAEEEEDDGEPYPLSLCRTTDDVDDCVRRAFDAEGIGIRQLDVLGQHPWGWEIDLTLKGKGSTIEKISAASAELRTYFNIKRSGLLIEGDDNASAHLVLRLVTDNPFANMPKPTPAAPNSLDIAQPRTFGLCMDGSDLTLTLDGLRGLVIGVSGSAKSTGVLRCLAEAITASSNAIAIEMDPVKDGMREFEPAMAVPAIRGAQACEEWLGYLLKMAEARAAVRNRLNMGDTWVPTPEHPAIFAFVDEYISLSPRAKELFIEFMRIAKQSGMYPIAAAQDGTSDALGDAIADSFTLRVMLAARKDDIRVVFGNGAAGAGFRPDLLTPAQNRHIKNDAGQSYIKGSGLTRPLLYGWHEFSNEQIKQAVAERAAARRPWFDRDTLAAAGLLHLEKLRPGVGEAPNGRSIVADAIQVMDETEAEGMFPEVLAEALTEAWPDEYEGITADAVKAELKEAGAGAPVPLGKRTETGQRRRGFKRDMLAALPR